MRSNCIFFQGENNFQERKISSRHVSKKSRKNHAPDGSDESDIENSSDDSLGSTRGFSPIGFLMVFCSSGLETSVTGSDSGKRKVIEFIEKNYEKKVHIEESVAGTRKPGQIHCASTGGAKRSTPGE